MSKYDFEIDLSLNSSTGMILNKIKKGSTVLEFGCATGRMTRYMKEALECSVYIVEYDEAAFHKAMEFAADGICGDIETYSWLTRFGDVAFDTIIFADVLEHLRQPETALQKAAGLLKEDGLIHISIPNVTHNDVVLKAVEEHFDYSKIGILDDTHVHFWGLENIGALGDAAGLAVVSLEGTYCATGDTEQGVRLGENLLLENILRERQAGEVYQFVVTMAKHGVSEPECTVRAQNIKSHIYLDTGSDFNEEQVIAVEAVYSGTGSYLISYELEDVDQIQRVRLDPVERQGVLLRGISIRQNGKDLQLVLPNAIRLDAGIYLPGDDPMVLAQTQPGEGEVTFTAEFVLPGQGYLQVMEEAVRNDQITLARTVEEHRQDVLALQREIGELHAQKAQLDAQNRTVNNQLVRTQREMAQLRTDLGAYIILVNRKELRTLELERSVAEKERCIAEKEQCIAEKERCIAEKEQCIAAKEWHIAEQDKSLNYYRNLRVVRLRAFVLRVLRKLKRCLKRILGRTN